jgi:ketosteroid isomerase-like protein
MDMAKEEIISLQNQLPDDCSLDVIQSRLMARQPEDGRRRQTARRFVLTVLAALMLGALSPLATSDSQTLTVAQELSQLEQRLMKAAVEKDLDTYGSILASDWTTIDVTGRVLSKSQVMQEFASQDRQIETARIDDIRVRELGGVAVVTGRTTATGRYRGERSSIVLRFTDVFVKRDGRWQIVASQGTPVAR